MGPLKPSPESPWPSPTRFPTLTPLISPELVGQGLCGCGPELQQRLLMLWGKASSTLISRETWLLEIKLGSYECSWKEVSTGLSLIPRFFGAAPKEPGYEASIDLHHLFSVLCFFGGKGFFDSCLITCCLLVSGLLIMSHKPC